MNVAAMANAIPKIASQFPLRALAGWLKNFSPTMKRKAEAR
jgi:hypothetical protein